MVGDNGIDILEQSIYEISPNLMALLLKDKTTDENIKWATDTYRINGEEYSPELPILVEQITGENTTVIQPRTEKDAEEQARRTRDNAEVFTPSWICNKQNNLVDEAWFGKANIFNIENNCEWTATEKIIFTGEKGKSWCDYIDARRMEISCGEAPYLVSRYDTVTGKPIEVKKRIGLLDRKLRVVSENTETEEDWCKWALRAVQSCYGFDYQGDNVLLARENIVLTYIDHFQDKFEKEAPLKEIRKVANVAAWNIWQMDGLTYTAPYSQQDKVNEQLSLFEEIGKEAIPCMIYDWRAERKYTYKSVVEE